MLTQTKKYYFFSPGQMKSKSIVLWFFIIQVLYSLVKQNNEDPFLDLDKIPNLLQGTSSYTSMICYTPKTASILSTLSLINFTSPTPPQTPSLTSHSLLNYPNSRKPKTLHSQEIQSSAANVCIQVQAQANPSMPSQSEMVCLSPTQNWANKSSSN